MKHKFITHNHTGRLILVFAGWAMDDAPFAALSRPGYDIMVVWDYRDFFIDWSCVAEYREICVVAWSLGVYASSISTHAINARITRRIAVNGTLHPVDRRCGIPESTFEGTLNGLNERSLHKFYRRMAGSSEAFAEFSSHMPARNVEELKDELRAFYPLPLLGHDPIGRWDLAIIGSDDAIFPAINQWRAWQGTPLIIIDAPHLIDLQGIIDRYIVDKQRVGERFAAGRSSYDSGARVQSAVVDRMRAFIESYDITPTISRRGARTLEIGCGTGMLSRVLHRMIGPDGNLEMWDIVDAAPLEGSGRRFRQGDAELMMMGCPSASFDFITTASTIQWFNSPGRFLAECARTLVPGGYLVAGTYAKGNLEEVSRLTGRSLPLMTAQEWTQTIPAAFEIKEMVECRLPLVFDSAIDVFRHLKATGVNSLGRSSTGETDLRTVLRQYHPDLDGRFRITYRPLVFVLQKKKK